MYSILRILVLPILLLITACTSMAPNDGSGNSSPKKGYRVCTASPCSPNGSKLLYDALQMLSTEETFIKEDYCLGGCCSGTVVKPYGMNSRRRTLPIIGDEKKALHTAEVLLREVDGIDPGKWDALLAKVEAGERAFENSQEPDICQNCGVGLQLYRGNCAKCGKNPYR